MGTVDNIFASVNSKWEYTRTSNVKFPLYKKVLYNTIIYSLIKMGNMSNFSSLNFLKQNHKNSCHTPPNWFQQITIEDQDWGLNKDAWVPPTCFVSLSAVAQIKGSSYCKRDICWNLSSLWV